MLYLFLDEKKDTNLLKIGRADDLANREKSYNTTNPLVNKIAYIKMRNDKLAEKEYHVELSLLGFERVGKTEWFKISNGVCEYIKLYGFNSFETTKSYNNISYKYGTDTRHPLPKLKLKDYT